MHKIRSSAPSSFPIKNIPRLYFVLLFLLILFVTYRYHRSSPVAFKAILADSSHLPQSSLFTYLNLSSLVRLNETQGLLFIPPPDKPSHFASIFPKAVRGNHHHKDPENKISGEVIILLEGQFQFRISDIETDKYEDYQFNVSQTGIVAVQFIADKCHGLKNIGQQTGWFASYYIKFKDFVTPFTDKEACRKMALT